MFVCDGYHDNPNSMEFNSTDQFTIHDTETAAHVYPAFRPLHSEISIDRERRILSPTADEVDELLSAFECLKRRDGRLFILDQEAMRRVRQFLTDTNEGDRYRQVVRCEYRKWPLLLELETRATSINVKIVDVGAPILLDQEALRLGFSLTKTEIKIAELIANGAKPAEIASLSEIAVSTVRTHVKSLFSKTRASNQLELALLLSHFRKIS